MVFVEVLRGREQEVWIPLLRSLVKVQILYYSLPVDGSDLCCEALEPVSLNTLQVTPPRPVGEVKKSVIDFDDFEKLLGHLRES